MLYTVEVDDLAGTAQATLVVDLETRGYPAGGLVDGMGWIARPCENTPVSISSQPASAALPVGGSLTLEVVADGTPPLSYQWRRGGIALADAGNVLGATAATLTIDPVAPSDAGLYECVVTNVCGSLRSDTALVSVGGAANASGYLWMGAEYSGEGSYYRYDVAGNVIDRVCPRALPAGGEHWNNMATDGTHLYLGVPNGPFLGRASGANCDAVADLGYAPALAGRLEDGAYRQSSDTLWRVTYTGQLHETTTEGVAVQSYSVAGGLVGLTWVGETLYATRHSDGSFGEIALAAPIATYTAIPWVGSPPMGKLGGLASDPGSGTIFLVTRDGLLYTVTIDGGLATATAVEDLNSVGLPEGTLPDGLGWIGTCSAATDLTILFGADKATLSWPMAPDATYDVISGRFSRHTAMNVWTGPGGVLATTSCRGNDLGSGTYDTTGQEEPVPGDVAMWLVRACAGSWNSPGSGDRDADVLCP